MKKILSFLLVICMITSLFVGIIPQEAQAAEEIITDAATLQARLNDNTQTVFTLSGTLLFDETISIPAGRNITIRSVDGSRALVRPRSATWPVGTPLFKISATANVTFQNVTVIGTADLGNKQMSLAQGIAVEVGGANVTLSSVSIFDCNGGTKSGAGLSVGGAFQGYKAELTLDGCVFWNNVTSLKSATCGVKTGGRFF